mmetsp:Transcript_24515/g.30123  ORF Transcript_24515/g.30123 Transcript_24515/m.30123 type:complete len:80 (-) Transcript_24515:65-304(-)
MTSKNGQPISSWFKSLYQTAKRNPVPDWSSDEDDFPLASLHCASPKKRARIKNGSKAIFKGTKHGIILFDGLLKRQNSC